MRHLLFIFACLFIETSVADSKRIEVYPISQAYVDVKFGDTLGEIVTQLLPHTPSKRERMMNEIIQLNPSAFVDSDIDKLKANVRLWLPGHTTGLRTAIDRNKYHVKEFSWGYIQQAK